MPSNSKVSLFIVNQQADLLARLLDDGFMKIYDGIQPNTPEDPITTQVELVSLRFSLTSAPAATNGTITFNVLPDEAINDGIMTWYRCLASDGTTVIMDGNVGLVDESLLFYNNTVFTGQEISINFQHTVGN